MEQKPPSLPERIQIWMESVILTRLTPRGSPGPVFRMLFKVPILFYRCGLGQLVGEHFILLTTTGRKTGKSHATPLEFSIDEATGGYILMAGWGGKTDWYKNACARPQVQGQIGRRRFRATASPLPVEEVARIMRKVCLQAPRMQAVWQRWSDRKIDGTPESYLYAAQFFPSLLLLPEPPPER